MTNSTDRISWVDVNAEERKKLFQRTGLIHGVYADGSRSSLPVLDVDQAGLLFHGLDLLNAQSKAETVQSKREASFLQKGWTQASAEVSSPWVSASAKYREEEERGHTSKQEYSYTTATYRIPTYQVQVTKDAAARALSNEFMGKVKDAVADNKPSEAVKRVFEDYGYIIQLKVELGASIVMSATQKKTATTDESKSKRTMEAEVSGKFGSFTGGAKFGKENEEEKKSLVDDQVGSVRTDVNGGDKKLLTDTKAWLATTEDINRLTIIWTSDIVLITDLIELRDKELYAKLEQVYGQPLIGMWVPATSWKNPLLLGASVESTIRVHSFVDVVLPTLYPSQFNLPLSFPDDDWVKKGWCVIGDIIDPGFVLLVREAPGHSGALGTSTFGKADIAQITWNISFPSAVASMGIRQAQPDSDGYAIIGAAIGRPKPTALFGFGLGVTVPIITTNPDNFRAVRKDLLTEATFSYNMTNISTSSINYSGWRIVPKSPDVGIDTGFFWPDTGSGQRDDMLKKNYPLYVLRKSAIKMLNSPPTMEDMFNLVLGLVSSKPSN